MKSTWLVIICFLVLPILHNGQITIDSSSLEAMQFNKDICGLNFGLIYPIIALERDSTGKILKDSISNNFVDALIEDDISKLRFPAGTFSQFYHFNGRKGYGYDSMELICRPGTLDDSLILGRMTLDTIYSKNHAHYMVDLHKKLLATTGKPLEIVYVANLLSHFNLNHFNKYNEGIEAYIRSGILSLVPFADINFDVIDTLLAYQLAKRINKIIDLPTGNNFIEILQSDSNIVKQINENLNCIKFLKDNGIIIRKVELGNEMYNQLEVYDDDCDKIGFDCTLPDSLAFPYNRSKLTIYSFCEGLFKYFLLSKIYASLIDTIDNSIAIGLCGSVGNQSMVMNSDSSIFVNTAFNSIGKQDLMWNNMIATTTYCDAVVLHIYLQQLPICEVLQQEGVNPEAFIYVIKKFIDYYTDTLLDTIIEKTTNIIPNKKIWITEWNIGGANIIANSFAHTTFIHKYWKAMYDIKKRFTQIDDLTYHNVIASYNPQFSIYNGYNDTITYRYTFSKNDLYYGFMPSYHVYNNFPKVQITHPYHDILMDMFYDAQDEKYLLLYMNNSGEALSIDTRQIQKSTNSLHPAIVHHEILNANYWCSSDRAFCDTSLCESEDSIIYHYAADTLLRGIYTLPGYSIGMLTLDFDAPTSISNTLSSYFKIYPNPAKNNFTVSMSDNDKYHYEIIDISGQIIIKDSFYGNSYTIDCTPWPKSLYWIKIYSEKMLSFTQPIVIN